MLVVTGLIVFDVTNKYYLDEWVCLAKYLMLHVNDECCMSYEKYLTVILSIF